MVKIEKRPHEWVVVDRDRVVSMHPTRTEAERVLRWLLQHAPESPAPASSAV